MAGSDTSICRRRGKRCNWSCSDFRDTAVQNSSNRCTICGTTNKFLPFGSLASLMRAMVQVPEGIGGGRTKDSFQQTHRKTCQWIKRRGMKGHGSNGGV